MTEKQYYDRFVEKWNAMAKDGLIHPDQEHGVEAYLRAIAQMCHEIDHNHECQRRHHWDVCASKFAEFRREVWLRFGIDLIEKTRKETEG